MTEPAITGRNRVFHTMGTVVSVTFGDNTAKHRADAAIESVARVFADADIRYSLYRPESELSQIARRELSLSAASEELRRMYDLAIGWRNSTNGAFSPHRGDGVVDLSGVVKAWAIAAAGTTLTGLHMTAWCINAGGDILTSGANHGQPWTVGIVNPADRTRLLASIRPPDGLPALATSGSAERGEHIWTHTLETAGQFTQVSVLGPDIVTADALATAIIAGGRATMGLATSTWPIELLAVCPNGDLLATPGFRLALAS